MARGRKTRRVKISGFFCLETLKNFILNDTFYLNVTTIRAFFLQIRALISNFHKRAGETPPPPPSPSSNAPVTNMESVSKKKIQDIDQSSEMSAQAIMQYWLKSTKIIKIALFVSNSVPQIQSDHQSCCTECRIL